MEHAFLPQNILEPEEIVYDLDGNEETEKSGPLEYNWQEEEEEIAQETEPEPDSARDKPKKVALLNVFS